MTVMSHHAFLLLMLCVGVTVSRMVDLQKRIYGGGACGDERLYHVSLSEKSDGKPGYCGGSLIHKQWVLTAAHCKDDPLYAVVGVHPSGTGRAMKIDTKDIIPHDHDDIMLLKLPQPITDIDPVPLPTCDNKNPNQKPQKGDEVQLAGHGSNKIDPKTKEKLHGPPEPVLQCGLMQVDDCADTAKHTCYLTKPYVPQGNRLCYKDTVVDGSKGDSGGGVIYDSKIYGVHIGDGDYVCSVTAVSLKVCSYIDWINETIKK